MRKMLLSLLLVLTLVSGSFGTTFANEDKNNSDPIAKNIEEESGLQDEDVYEEPPERIEENADRYDRG